MPRCTVLVWALSASIASRISAAISRRPISCSCRDSFLNQRATNARARSSGVELVIATLLRDPSRGVTLKVADGAADPAPGRRGRAVEALSRKHRPLLGDVGGVGAVKVDEASCRLERLWIVLHLEISLYRALGQRHRVAGIKRDPTRATP